MRIIAEFPHPNFKISIFNMNQKFILKLEQGHCEQIYKIAESDVLGGVESLQQLFDEKFSNQVNETFKLMRNAFDETLSRSDVM